MKYSLATTKQFDKALKRCRKRGYNLGKLKKVIEILVEDGKLPVNYKPHAFNWHAC